MCFVFSFKNCIFKNIIGTQTSQNVIFFKYTLVLLDQNIVSGRFRYNIFHYDSANNYYYNNYLIFFPIISHEFHNTFKHEKVKRKKSKICRLTLYLK